MAKIFFGSKWKAKDTKKGRSLEVIAILACLPRHLYSSAFGKGTEGVLTVGSNVAFEHYPIVYIKIFLGSELLNLIVLKLGLAAVRTVEV